MGGCCSNTHSQMDYLDELRQDAKISEYETKDNDDIFKSIVSPRLDEKIVFQIKDDEYEQYSKELFKKLNEIRTNPILYLDKSKQNNLHSTIENIIKTKQQNTTLLSWSTKKGQFIQNYFHSPKNAFKTNQQKINDIKDKYSNDFVIVYIKVKGILCEPEIALWNLIKDNKDNNVIMKQIFNDNYVYCIIYTELEMDLSDKFNNCNNKNKNNVISHIFLFKSIAY
jgi:hypothetical protein